MTNLYYFYQKHSLFLTPVSSEEIIKVLNDFKPKKNNRPLWHIHAIT